MELVPFRAAIKNDIDAIMIAHIALPELEPTPNLPASLSKKIVTELLKEELGFEGLILTDGLGMCGATMNQIPGAIEVQALIAGADILLCPRDAAIAIKSIVEAVEKGLISIESIDKKVLRTIKAKKHAMQAASAAKAPPKEEMVKLRTKMYTQAVTLVFDKRTHPALESTLSVAPPSRYAGNNFGITQEQLEMLDKKRAEGMQVTVVIFGTPYAVDLFAPRADRLIVAYEDTPETRLAVEQIINGTLIPCGKLPV